MLRVLLLIISGLAMCTLAVSAEPRDISPELEAVRVKYKLPGCASAVIEKGRITAIGASGIRQAGRNAPVTTADIWWIASCTKAMTATLVGMLVDAGKLRWDMPIPEALRGMPCDASWRKITVWDLITHRSGLGQVWMPEAGFSGLFSPREQREMFARSLLSHAPEETPGKFSYSNAGYGLLGAILERASGETYEELLRKRIFTPLSLESAGFGPPTMQLGRLDQPFGHRRQGDRFLPVDPSISGRYPSMLTPAAGVHMSLEDFARYAAWISGNEPVLVKPETFARLQTPPAGESYAGGLWKTKMPGIGGAAVCHTGTMGGFFAVFYSSRDCACVSVFNAEAIGWEWQGDEITAAALNASR